MTFVGGPYDGMEIDYPLVDRHATVVRLTGDLGTRLFVLMPPHPSWVSLLRDEPAATEPRIPYERVFGPDGAHFEARSEDDFGEAQLEASLKVHSRARTALATLSERDRSAILKAVSRLQHQDPASWPLEKVSPNGSDRPVYLLHVSPDLLAFVQTSGPHGIELLDIMWEETLRVFLERYSAGSRAG